MNLNSQEFHNKYSDMLEHKVKVVLNSDYVINYVKKNNSIETILPYNLYYK